jgi:hypothetical protein
MAEAIEVKKYRKFTIYDSGVPGDPCRFFAEGTEAPGKTIPDTGSSVEELEEKLTKYPVARSNALREMKE